MQSGAPQFFLWVYFHHQTIHIGYIHLHFQHIRSPTHVNQLSQVWAPRIAHISQYFPILYLHQKFGFIIAHQPEIA